MTYLTLKIIAMLTMTIDHLGVALGALPALQVPSNIILLMRSIGRIAFPIYAFGIVNGMKYTSNKRRYFYRLSIFMGLSQIPFSMLSSGENYIAEFRLKDLLSLNFSLKITEIVIMALVFILVFLYLNRTRVKTSISLIIATLLSIVSIYTETGYMINDPSYLNVFYTLAISAYVIIILEDFKENEFNSKDLILNTILLVSMVSIFISYSDYSYLGLILIIGIYLLKDSKPMLLAYMAMWLFLSYGLRPDSKLYFILSLSSVLFIYLYKGEKGQGPKILQKLFYIYYPLHLAVGAVLSIILR